MILENLKSLIQEIVIKAVRLKNTHTDEKLAKVNYVAIFCQSQNEYAELIEVAKQLGEVIEETPTGPLFHISELETVAGYLKLLKIRKPDDLREEIGDADFTIDEYSEFKSKYLDKSNFKLIKREKFEMIELADSDFDVLVYFSNPPLDQQLGLKICRSFISD